MPEINRLCPRCGGDLVIRENRQDKSRFLGCERYPSCAHTEELPAYFALRESGAPELPGLDS